MALAIVVHTVSVAPWAALNAQVPTAKPKTKIQKPALGKPFTMERLLTGLQDVKNGDFTEPALVKRLMKDGVTFSSMPENLERLRAAGASTALIDAVHKVAVPPVVAPPIPKPQPKGNLEVTCAPAECEVSVGTARPQPTNRGKLQFSGIAEGELSVVASKQGFIASESRVRVAADKTSLLRVDLKPTRKTLELWGEQLRSGAVESLGGEPALTSMQDMYASGDCTVWGQDGKPYPSSIQMLMRAAGKAFFRTNAGKGGSYEVDYLPAFQVKTNFPEQQARALDAGLRLVNQYQVAALLSRMKKPEMTLFAESAAPAKEGAVFHAESSTESFTVSLDPEGRPKEILQANPLGKGIRAEYSDYKLEKGSYIPTRVMIVWPGTPQQGISIHLTAFDLNPDKTKDAFYSVKKRRRLW